MTLPKHLTDEIEEHSKSSKLTDKQKKEVIERVTEAYEKSKITPGEAIGVITAESIGEPSTQMSIERNEKMIIKYNNKIKIIKIGNFVDALMDSKGFMNFNKSEILPLHDLEIYVPSINQEEKIEWKRVLECSRHNTEKKLMRLITSSGRQITATDNHSFVIRSNNQIIPVKGSELTIGDRIPVINNFLQHETPSREIQINKNIEMQNLIVTEEGLLMKSGTNAKPLKNTLNLDNKTGWFIGAYLAEGMSCYGQVNISNIDDKYCENAKKFIKNINLDYKEDRHHRGFAESRDIKVSSTLLAEFIMKSCGKGSNNKKVPEFAYNASNEFISGLLRGYFDGDGNFHASRKMIRASSNSKDLIDSIALLLSRFKIFSYKIKDKKNQHWLLIPYKYAPLFLLNIGSDIEYKKKALIKLSEKSKKFWNKRSKDYTDMISGFGNLFHSTAKKLGYPTRYINNFTKRQKIGRTALYRYTKLFEEIANKKNIDINDELVIMKRMFNSDIIWDKIEKIEYVENKDPVYDISVSGLETFTTSEGIVTHNTLNVFHFAGVSEMNVTVGLPRLIEIFDARKNPSTPKMEIYLKSKYGKSAQTVKEIATKIKETNLEEITSDFSINIGKNSINIELDRKRLKELDVKVETVVEKLSAIKGMDVKVDKNLIVLKSKNKEIELIEVYKIKEKIKKLNIAGLKGITQVLPIKAEDEFVIHCAGTNLKGALEMEEIDSTRTMTNQIFEIAEVLGIEAARNAIMREAIKVIKDQALDIDVRHIMFIADAMTRTGTIKGVTRGGITGEKESVLARASFETPIKHIIRATLIGEKDDLNSVVENVIVNQPIPLGTGLPGLVAKMKGKEK